MRKNRKFYVGLLIFVALLCMGIGYAAITGTLVINGTISTADADDLGNLGVYFTAAEDLTPATMAAKNTPALAGTSTDFGATVISWSKGYKEATITVTEVSDATWTYSKFVIVSKEDSTNDVEIGYTATITYSGTEVDINEYFTVSGYFASHTSELSIANFDNTSMGTTTLSAGNACAFFVRVAMVKVPPVALTGVEITITLTYNAK